MCKQQVPFSELLRGVWRAALTLANNLCVQESDRENERDGNPEHIHAAAECARRIRGWMDPTGEQLAEMLREAGVGGLGVGAAGGTDSTQPIPAAPRGASSPEEPKSFEERVDEARRMIAQWPLDVRVALGLADDL